MSLKETSKFISLILRHKPETIGITLDEHGWANVDELIAGVAKTHPIDVTYKHGMEEPEEIHEKPENDGFMHLPEGIQEELPFK